MLEHATLEVLVLSRCWVEDYGEDDLECDLKLRYTRLALSVPVMRRFALVLTWP